MPSWIALWAPLRNRAVLLTVNNFQLCPFLSVFMHQMHYLSKSVCGAAGGGWGWKGVERVVGERDGGLADTNRHFFGLVTQRLSWEWELPAGVFSAPIGPKLSLPFPSLVWCVSRGEYKVQSLLL